MASLNIAQLRSLAQQAGLKGNAINIAAAIAMAESGGRTDAHALTPYENSWGLWQINLLAHPQYTAAQMQTPSGNARAMVAISNGGTNWNPWTTYTSGRYLQYLNGTGTTPSVKTGNANGFPLGQCTWWADERYHQLTGYYVPWNGNAYQWYQGAVSSGWQTSATPPKGIPSIIVMQPNVQGASSLGHVGVVEKVNNNGTVTVSNMNWATGPVLQTVQGYPIRQTTINVGAGIGFVWASGSGNTSTNGLMDFTTNAVKAFNLAPNANVTELLVAMDDYLTLVNPFDVQGVQQDNVAGVTFGDPVDWLTKFGTNLVDDTSALILRGLFILLAAFLMYNVLSNFVDFKAISQDAGQVASKLALLAA